MTTCIKRSGSRLKNFIKALLIVGEGEKEHFAFQKVHNDQDNVPVKISNLNHEITKKPEPDTMSWFFGGSKGLLEKIVKLHAK